MVPTTVSGYVSSYQVVVPESVRKRVINTLAQLPERHYLGAKVQWYDVTDHYNRYYGKGPHGMYLKEKDMFIFRPLKSLSKRTVVHEVGHRVYHKHLTEEERSKWHETALDDTQLKRIPYGPKKWMTEEYFSELYAQLYYARGALISLAYATPEIQSLLSTLKTRFERVCDNDPPDERAGERNGCT